RLSHCPSNQNEQRRTHADMQMVLAYHILHTLWASTVALILIRLAEILSNFAIQNLRDSYTSKQSVR
ncbi:MAG: hypothetical protein II926_08835, partial [Bacteroidales bacterium]|nr:hypothetical protein [Bacteroidales bacterium]